MHENYDFEPVYDEFYRLCAGKTTRAKFLKRAGQPRTVGGSHWCLCQSL